MGLTVEVSKAILTEAQNSGFLEGEIPEDGAAQMAEAIYWIEEAQKAFDTGMKDDVIVAILNLADGAEILPTGDLPEPEPEPEKPAPKTRKKAEPKTEEAPAPGTHPLEAFISKENLPIPAEIEGEANIMPRDLTAVDDKHIRLLHGEYGAYLSRSKWLLAVASSDVANATHLRDDAYRVALQSVERVDSETSKAKLASVIEAEAKDDEKYQKLEGELRQHVARQTSFKALCDIYGGNVDRLSREWTMRQDEFGKTR